MEDTERKSYVILTYANHVHNVFSKRQRVTSGCGCVGEHLFQVVVEDIRILRGVALFWNGTLEQSVYCTSQAEVRQFSQV